ncbi:hypothetical protein BJ912DRAFT_941541 [Pholiota molesta]|nr:hypothetical protein BJ912DRAFT_941541 [Pholiota molesta]
MISIHTFFTNFHDSHFITTMTLMFHSHIVSFHILLAACASSRRPSYYYYSPLHTIIYCIAFLLIFTSISLPNLDFIRYFRILSIILSCK